MKTCSIQAERIIFHSKKLNAKAKAFFKRETLLDHWYSCFCCCYHDHLSCDLLFFSSWPVKLSPISSCIAWSKNTINSSIIATSVWPSNTRWNRWMFYLSGQKIIGWLVMSFMNIKLLSKTIRIFCMTLMNVIRLSKLFNIFTYVRFNPSSSDE